MNPSVLIVIPARNESAVIGTTLEAAVSACRRLLSGYRWRILVSENGSTDDTASLARAFATQHPEVAVESKGAPGKGAAVIGSWRGATEDVLVFTDADLAADLAALPALVRASEGGGGLAIGSRVAPGARARRSFIRAIGSRAYGALARTLLGVPISDWQCGLKAITREAALYILPEVRATGWFFDTELIALAHRAGIPVAEVPVDWEEARAPGRASTLAPVRTFLRFMRELVVLRRRIGPASRARIA